MLEKGFKHELGFFMDLFLILVLRSGISVYFIKRAIADCGVSKKRFCPILNANFHVLLSLA